MLSSKHISKITIALISAALILCVLAMTFYDKLLPVVNTSGYSMEYEDKLFDTSEILDIDIVMDDEKWNEMLQNAQQEVYYECDVIINGTTFKQVGIRPKGNTSLSSIANDPNNNRYSFKLEFDQFVDGQTCFGLDKLILNNSFADSTNMKEAIIYDMFQFLDAAASLYNYAKISVNNDYWGVYLALEAVEDSFMLRNYGMEKGYLYKPDNMNFGGGVNKKQADNNKFPTPPEGGFGMPENFRNNGENRMQMPGFDNNSQQSNDENKNMQGERRKFDKGNFDGSERGGFGGFGGMGGGSNLNYTDDNLDSYQTIWNSEVNDSTDADHKRVVKALKNVHGGTDIEKYIDVEGVLKYMAVHNFSVNDDSLSGSMSHNYYLYEANGRISILPWDYNLSFGGMHGGNATNVINEPIDELWKGTKLFDFVLQNEEYKARYHEYYEKLINEYIYGGVFSKTYNRIRAQIDFLVETDPNSMYTYEEYLKGVQVLYDAVMLRAESIKGQLEGTIPSLAETQNADSSKLVDASHLNLSDLGQFMMGGGNREGNRQIFGNNKNATSE